MNARQKIRDVVFFMTLFFSVLAVVQAQEAACSATSSTPAAVCEVSL